jgi:hypothetical protein
MKVKNDSFDIPPLEKGDKGGFETHNPGKITPRLLPVPRSFSEGGCQRRDLLKLSLTLCPP